MTYKKQAKGIDCDRAVNHFKVFKIAAMCSI